MDINNLRKEIDATDFEIIRLFEKRMNISKGIGEYKKLKNLPLLDEGRENALFENRIAMLADKRFAPHLQQLLSTLVELSKGYQLQCTAGKNIALIGMMGSGKTSKGKVIAKRLGMKFIDIDKKIETDENLPITQIFQTLGEKRFRELENAKIKEYAKQKGFVISTGGGAVLCEDNMKALKENAIIIFLNRDVEITVNSIDAKCRPLLKDGAEKLHDIYNERLPLYKRWSDIEITGEYETIDNAAEVIIKKIFKSAR